MDPMQRLVLEVAYESFENGTSAHPFYQNLMYAKAPLRPSSWHSDGKASKKQDGSIQRRHDGRLSRDCRA
jgi:hypothetical protein